MNFEKLLGWNLFAIISWPIHALFCPCCVISKYSSQLFSCFTQTGDQVTPGSICLTFAAQFLSLGESYLACDLGVGCGGERVSNVQFSMSGVKVIVMSCNTDSHTGNKGRKTHIPFTFAKEVKRNRKNLGASHGAPKIVTICTRCYLWN